MRGDFKRPVLSEILTLIDNRTSNEYEIEIHDGNIRAKDLCKSSNDDDFGMMSYDPSLRYCFM